MAKPEFPQVKVDTERFYILNPVPPYVDIILKSYTVSPMDFARIVELTFGYRNDPRLIEMVRKAGDGSAKVPYLIDNGETPQSILNTLREIAQPHVEHMHSLPDKVQATIRGLLSINTVPQGCEDLGIPALLEIDHMQGKIIKTLKKMMAGRKLAKDFHDENRAALRLLDADWSRLRKMTIPTWGSGQTIPERSEMQFVPVFEKKRLSRIYESCVIIDAPGVRKFKRYIPEVLKRPISESEPLPVMGSEDWLIREVGKIGRHFTRALLKIINDRLEAEQIALEASNYALINKRAQEALREFIERTP
ncbi:MAG: hypothetical protein JW908_12760 [Anaerolineales bacterium]|nr:hypothetical protein [Anaerolineales bacterium]